MSVQPAASSTRPHRQSTSDRRQRGGIRSGRSFGGTCNPLDQLTQELTGDILTTYQYDANGSQVERKVGTQAANTYVYDLRNSLTGAAVAGVSSTYVYDHAGSRVSKTVSGQITYHLVDLNNPTGYSQVLEESATAGGTPSRRYVLGQDVVAQAAGTTVQYLMYDGHGSTRALLSASGLIVAGQRYDYDAFGNALPSNPASPGTTLLYAGEQWDAEKGSYFLRGRPIYDPALGRFSTADSLILAAGDILNSNLYVYVANNSINAVDPNGHEFTLVGLASAAGIRTTLSGITDGAGNRVFNYVATGQIFGVADGIQAGLASLPFVMPLLSGGFALLGRHAGRWTGVANRLGSLMRERGVIDAPNRMLPSGVSQAQEFRVLELMTEGSRHPALADRTVVAAGYQLEQLLFGTRGNTICADFLSLMRNGGLAITESKGTDVGHAVQQLSQTTWALVHDLGADAVRRAEIAISRGTTMSGDFAEVNGLLVRASTREPVRAEHLPIHVIRI